MSAAGAIVRMGGPFVGPYVAAALNVNTVAVGGQGGTVPTYGQVGPYHIVTIDVTGNGSAITSDPRPWIGFGRRDKGASADQFELLLPNVSQSTTLTIHDLNRDTAGPAGVSLSTVAKQQQQSRNGTLTINKVLIRRLPRT
jgi:hypothetical protein